MTERERLFAVLEGRHPDRTPWYGDLSWWYEARKARGLLPAAYEGEEGYLRFHVEVGCGIYLYPPQLWTERPDDSVRRSVERTGDLTVTVLRTPIGSVRSAVRDLPDSATGAYVEHFVKEPADLRVMRHVFTHRRVSPSPAAFARIDTLWNGHGVACALAPICTAPLQSLLSRWAGVETTVALLADAREEVELTIAEIERADDGVFRIIRDSPALLVALPENLSGEITGRRLLERYDIPYWRRRIRELHDAGKRVILHNDGTLRASLPLLVAIGLDAVEAVTPAPVGDMDLEEIRECAAGKTVIWGGLPGALFSPLYDDAFFDGFVRRVLAVFPPGSGFVLGVADQVPPDAELTRIRRVRELVEQSG